MRKLLRHAAATTLPVLAAKAWKRAEPVRDRAIEAAKSLPGHVRDVMREKREERG